MNLGRLELFCEVVERAGFTAAAQHLYLTQSAVSQYVKALEEQVGSELLVREGRRIYPTEAGEIVYQAAREIARVWDEAQVTVRELKGAEAGTVRLACSTPGDYFLPPLISRFAAAHPKAHVIFSVDRPEEVVDHVRRGEFDFAFVTLTDSPAELQCEPIRQEELVLVAASGHPFAKRLSVDREELLSQPFVCAPAESQMRQIIDAQLRVLHLGPRRVTLEFDNAEAAKLAVQSGAGLAILFRASVEQELASGTLKQVHAGGLSMAHDVLIISRPKRRFSPIMRQLLEFLRGEVG
ncbi:MAG TPA: LysR family transcriptional regulator [Chloroflexota bacterium]|nr:LysR family transcriptional regulator [Chloroflexota bacterium]